jgi:hypothetical protein
MQVPVDLAKHSRSRKLVNVWNYYYSNASFVLTLNLNVSYTPPTTPSSSHYAIFINLT